MLKYVLVALLLVPAPLFAQGGPWPERIRSPS